MEFFDTDHKKKFKEFMRQARVAENQKDWQAALFILF